MIANDEISDLDSVDAHYQSTYVAYQNIYTNLYQIFTLFFFFFFCMPCPLDIFFFSFFLYICKMRLDADQYPSFL